MASVNGRCRFCDGSFSKSGMSRHLLACPGRTAALAGAAGKEKGTESLFHLVVSGRHAPQYWLHLEVPANTTLETLDAFLRDIWVECCGHLSAFTIRGTSYASLVDDVWGMDDESMNVKLSTVLGVGDTFPYEYDLGSTTYLGLKVVSQRQGRPLGRGVQVLAQNEAPFIPCDACGQEAATQICSACSWSGKGWLCDRCGKSHRCGEEMLLPVVNSPRVGVCGYTG